MSRLGLCGCANGMLIIDSGVFMASSGRVGSQVIYDAYQIL